MHVAIRGIVGEAIEARCRDVAILPAGPAVHVRAAREVVAGIDEQRFLLELRLAIPGVEAIERRFARIEHVARQQRILTPLVPAAALRVLLILVLGGERDEAGFAERQSFPERRDQRLAVGNVALQNRRR